jgi:beta-lactamase class A
MSSETENETDEERTDADDPLRKEVLAVLDESGAQKIAVAYHDYKTGETWHHLGNKEFHAASTIKVPVLVGVFHALHEKRYSLTLKARVHVRNLFQSAAENGGTFRVAAARDANAEVPRNIGKTMRVEELAYHMITTSSNLATNLLIDAVGAKYIERVLRDLGLDKGVEFHRGVEDDKAFEAGINNECTALGMLAVLRAIQEHKAVSQELSQKMLDIMHKQKFRSGIPAGVPADARVANKTGEISTVQHDAGIVYMKHREPYALVVLTEWDKSKTSGRSDPIAKISRAVFRHLTGGAA